MDSHKDHVDPSVAIARIVNINQELVELSNNDNANVEQGVLTTEVDGSLQALIDEFKAAVDSISPFGEPSPKGKDLEQQIQNNINDFTQYLQNNTGHKNNSEALIKIEGTREKIIEFISYETKYFKNYILGITIDTVLSKINDFRKSASSIQKVLLNKIVNALNAQKTSADIDSDSFDVDGAIKVVEDLEQGFNKLFSGN